MSLASPAPPLPPKEANDPAMRLCCGFRVNQILAGDGRPFLRPAQPAVILLFGILKRRPIAAALYIEKDSVGGGHRGFVM